MKVISLKNQPSATSYEPMIYGTFDYVRRVKAEKVKLLKHQQENMDDKLSNQKLKTAKVIFGDTSFGKAKRFIE